MKFETLGLNKALLEAIAMTGYTDPTDVQMRAIPEVLAGSDVLVSAQTGSGPVVNDITSGAPAVGAVMNRIVVGWGLDACAGMSMSSVVKDRY